jgi:predicted RNA binding protein YcfA (HicA-like mRNA interferase family)
VVLVLCVIQFLQYEERGSQAIQGAHAAYPSGFMSGVYHPLTCKQVKAILTNLGFEEGKQDGTSHVHWRKVVDGRLHKVTVDCPKAPFSQDLISSMARQAGVTKKQFYAAL